MEFFNRVSAAAGAVQSWLPGMLGSSKALAGGHGMRSVEPQPWMGSAGKDFEVGGVQGGTRGGVRHVPSEQGGNPAGSHSGDPWAGTPHDNGRPGQGGGSSAQNPGSGI